MMLKRLIAITLVFLFAAGCAAAPPEAVDSQSDASSATAEPTQDADADEDHGDEDHGDEDHGDEDHEHRELGAHEHGAAELTVAWSGNDVAIDLQTPAYNVIGFEYTPSTDEEKALLAESVAALEAGNLLLLNSEAACEVIAADVQAEISNEDHADEDHGDEDHADEDHADEDHGDEDHGDEDHADEDHADEDHADEDHADEDHADEDHADEDHADEDHAHEDHADEQSHSDMTVSYLLRCQEPDNIESLDAGPLFDQFPNFEALDVQWISDTQQSAATLTPDNPVLSFE